MLARCYSTWECGVSATRRGPEVTLAMLRTENNICVHVLLELQAADFLDGSNSCITLTHVVTRCHHRAEQRVLDLGTGISPEQAQDILHHSGITRQRDLSIPCEAKLLLGHPQELTKDQRAEVYQWYLEAPSVGRVHDAVALDRCRGAALIFFDCCCQTLPPKGCHPLPLPCQLSKFLGADHGWLWLFFFSWKFGEVGYRCCNAGMVVDELCC